MPEETDRAQIAENLELIKSQLAGIPTCRELAWMALLMVLSMAAIVVLIALLLR
jgi:hypothetical protein